MRRFVPALLALAALGPATRANGQEPVTRQEALDMAFAYQHLVWTPSSQNVFHGRDAEGIQVDTPNEGFRAPNVQPGWWVPGQRNVGVPYMWGGFSSLQEFTDGLRAGMYAGDMYSDDKRRLLEAAVSRHAVGIDCAGLVSRCWRLPCLYSTRTLPSLCIALDSYDDLRPGDILNADNKHVVLFKAWKDPQHQRLYAYNAGSPPTGKVILIDVGVASLHKADFKPYRYRLIKD